MRIKEGTKKSVKARPLAIALWVDRGTEKVETLKNQGQLSFPPRHKIWTASR